MVKTFAFILFVLVLGGDAAAPHENTDVVNTFKENEIVPDIIDRAPVGFLKINFPCGVRVKLGNELTPTQVKDIPQLDWSANPRHYYTLIFVDLDVPSRENPVYRSFVHWLVGNIPGDKVAKGKTLVEFVGSGPPLDTGLHRYVFLLYKQPSQITFDEALITNTQGLERLSFSVSSFVTKHNLGKPIAGNFYFAQYDKQTLVIMEQLGFLTLGQPALI